MENIENQDQNQENSHKQLMRYLESLEILPICCECKKSIKINNKWITLSEELIEKISKFNNLSHGYCEECGEKAKEELKKYMESRRK